MGRIRRMQANLGALLRSERGMAMPLVLTVLAIGLGLSAATVTAAVSALNGTTVDQDGKAALAIADAGAKQALLTYNKIPTDDIKPCVKKTGSGSSAVYSKDYIPSGSTPWCGPTGGATDPDAKVGNGYYTYQVMPCDPNYGASGTGCNSHPAGSRYVQIVSQGYQDGVTRRVSLRASGYAGGHGNSNSSLHLIGLNGIWLDGSSDIDFDIGTNGNVYMAGSSCASAGIEVGPGHVVNNSSSQCSPPAPTYGTLTLTPVSISAINASNSNSRLDPGVINTSAGDYETGSGYSWNSTTKTLTLTGSTTLTLSGANYSLCKLDMQGNSQLIMATGANTHIYFDSPEACGLSSPATQISVTGSSTISSTSWDQSTNSGSVLAFYMVGSNSRQTLANFTGNSTLGNQFQLYAPLTDVTLTGNTTYLGGAAGKTLTLGGSAFLTSSPNLPPPDAGGFLYIVYSTIIDVQCGASATITGGNC
jgi:hypothetical protein